MATFQPIPLDFEFDPRGMDELAAPLGLYKQEYDKRVADLDVRRQGIAAFAPYISEMTPEAKARYDALDRQIDYNAQFIGTPGYLLHEAPIIALKDAYGKTVADFTNSVKNLEEQRALAQQEKSRHPGLVFNYRGEDGELIDSPTIDHYLGNRRPAFYSVDTDDMMNKGAALAKGVSSRLAAVAAGSYVSTRDDATYGRVIEFKNRETGMPVKVALSWFLDPEGHADEIAAFKRAHPGREYQDLFDGSVASDIAALKEHTAYGALDDMNKARVDAAIAFGFDSGLGPYSVDKSMGMGSAPYAGGGGGGGGIDAMEPPQVQTTPKLYVTDSAGTPGEERYKSLLRYLGASDEDYTRTGDIKLRDRLSLRGGKRRFDDTDHSAADDIINGDDFSKFEAAGLKDYFSMFDDAGRLLTPEEFKDKYGDAVGGLNAKPYVDMMRGNADIGDLYERYYHDPTADFKAGVTKLPYDMTDKEAARSGAMDVYKGVEEAMLSAWEVPEAKARDILGDSTGGKFKAWMEKEGVTLPKFKMRLLDLADKYANVQRDLQYFRFSSDNEGIFKDVVKNNVKDGNLKLHRVTGYKYSKKDGARVLTTEVEPETDMGWDDVVPNGNYNGITYTIPADPHEGLIMRNANNGGEYLIPKENLGSLYNKPDIQRTINQIDDITAMRGQEQEARRQMYMELDNKMKNKSLPKDERREMLQRAYAMDSEFSEAIQRYNNALMGLRSTLTNLVKQNLSYSYKPAQD